MKRVLSIVVLALASACSGSAAAPTPPAPAAAVQGLGEGSLILHPSADARFGIAIDFPVRVRETAGGSAGWNFARLSLILRGAEIERNELGHDALVAAGIQNVMANSSQLVHF